MGFVGTRRGSFGEMYGDGWYGVVRDRVERQREEAEEARLARTLTRERDPLRVRARARAARWLFALAVAVERRETWRVVWERLGERGRL
ncbi:hypothetical protein [Rubrobacter marinus]|uniref:hypothetical protein n=1 Tax=Rubrobacter marinus TaxID=2653852 RepID=UPI001D187A47|nr:hypothetical protein [Rubrobacter marinus]